VISSLETAAVEQAMRMVRAKKQFAESRLLVVAGKERKETTLDLLGTKIRRVPRSSMNELFAKMPETEEAHAISRKMRKQARKIVEPTEKDTLNAARSFVTAKRLLLDEESNALTTDCLGMVQTKVVPTPPCMAATLFQDAGVTYGCEADVFGAISLMFASYLFDKPGFMNDPVPETVKNRLIAAHCVSPTLLNGFGAPAVPYILRSHSESNIGVSLQVLWREGQPVTLVRFKNPTELILDTGTVVANVNTPPAGGCRTSFEIAMDRVEDVRDVQGFHKVVFYGNHRRDVQAFCQMYGIKVVHSPEHAPAVDGGTPKPA
jgi:L-fucose isomerase-like protein